MFLETLFTRLLPSPEGSLKYTLVMVCLVALSAGT